MDAVVSFAKRTNYIPIRSDVVQQTAPNVPKEEQRNIIAGNWTLYWILGLLSSSLFFAPFSFNKPLIEARERQPFGPYMQIHLYSAGIISFVCLINIFHTPSHGPTYKVVHRWLGRVGLVASILASIFGFITTWFERFVSYGMSIGLSILAVQQIIYTFLGYASIRTAIKKQRELKEIQMNSDYVELTEEEQMKEREVKEYVEMHKFFMAGLWVCCLAPAWFRIPWIVANVPINGPVITISIVATTPFVYAFLNATEKKRMW